MTTFTFTLVLANAPEFTEEMAGVLYASGCDDATVSLHNSVPCVDFDRDAESFSDAVLSAIRNVEDCKLHGKSAGLHVLRVEPDDLVNAAEIARRAGVSREYVRLLSSGKRGSGGFPTPVCHCAGKALWGWTSVSAWLNANNIKIHVKSSSIDPRDVVLINAMLTTRSCEPTAKEEGRIRGALFPRRRSKPKRLAKTSSTGRGARAR
jgi:hypothetical protein